MFAGLRGLRFRNASGPAPALPLALCALLGWAFFPVFPAAAADEPSSAPAQPAGTAASEPGDLTFGPRSLAGASSQALEGALDAETYRLGPGDEIMVTLWGERSIAQDLVVTPEGKVLFPMVGEIVVNGLSLPEAKEKVRQAVLRAFHNVEISVTLVRLRTFQVHVVGEVVRPGTYEARAIDRVSAVVSRAGGLASGAGIRQIAVMQGDSTRTSADLMRFARLGDLAANPLLHDGDVVDVPMARERVWLYGDVMRPGEIELAPGDSLGGLIALAGGLSAGAVSESIEVSSYASDGVETTRACVLNGGNGRFLENGAPVPLHSDDHIFVRRLPQWHQDNIVTLVGEVMFPGAYDIEPSRTRLTEVVERAGGFTLEASLADAELIRTRGETQDREFERLAKLDPSEMKDEEYDYVRARTRLRAGRMTVDFVRLFNERDLQADVTLEAGDTIRVPRARDYVKVIGRVVRPGNVIYRPGAGPNYYIQEAGGYTWNARRSRVRVIKTVTGQWLRKEDADRLEAGDTVWVPEKPDRNYWQMVRDSVSFLTGLATIYLVVQTARGK